MARKYAKKLTLWMDKKTIFAQIFYSC